MLSNSIFKKTLTSPQSSIAHILRQLEPLFGCTYLANQNVATIGFLPKKYTIMMQQQIHIYNRTSLLNYEKELDHSSVLDSLSFKKQNKTDKTDCHPTHDASLKNIKNVPYFHGGYIGFIDYNFAAQQSIDSQIRTQPNLYLGLYETFLKYENGQWIFYSHEENALDLFELVQNLLFKPAIDIAHFQLTEKCMPRWSKQQYKHAFYKVQDYIKAGDCYQINLTQEFIAQATGSLLQTVEKFWQLTDAPYSGYLKINDFELLSCSPELFIDFQADRKIVTKPIKGTMPRFDDPILDEQSKNTLIHSEKDQAENVMIVDLLRNDLSVYAEIGSVKTPKLFNIESFNQVHHMVSEVTATLKADANPFDVLMSALPGGSITGAPKIRAMQIIEEIENAPRGAYCGSMGYFNFDGTGSWNILIRSIQKYQENVSLWAGGGITIASDCDAEYQECFDKVSAMLDLLNTWYLPESSNEKSES